MKVSAKVSMHSDWVTCLLEIPELGLTVSSSTDQKILVWETLTFVHRTDLFGHRKGVSCLTYSPQYRLVFSAGFDRDILVWNPVVPGALHKLKGHEKSIQYLYAMQSTPELISIDAGGSIRIWDMRSYACNQVVDHENIVFNATCFDYVSDYLVTSDNVWRVWRFSNISEDMTEWPVVSDRYNDTFQTFVVASSHGKITIWSAATGELTSAFNASRETELVSMQLHPYGRQILMGFQDGTILVREQTLCIEKKLEPPSAVKSQKEWKAEY